jgi:hypothetical protein
MAVLTKDQRNTIIELSKERIAVDGMAYIRELVADCHAQIGTSEISISEAERIAKIVLRDTEFRYSYEKAEKNRQVDFKLYLNPNFDINKSIMSTNRFSKVMAFLAALFSFITLVIAIINTLTSEKLKSPIKDINSTLQEQYESIKAINMSLDEISSAIEGKDTIVLKSQ